MSGNVLFVSDRAYPVSSAGSGSQIELMLHRYGASLTAQDKALSPEASATETSTAAIENTYWKLIHLQDAQITEHPENRNRTSSPTRKHIG